MSSHPTEFQGSVIDALREAIERQIPDSRAEVNGGGGHFNIEVTSPVFAGKNMLQSQRMVYGAIADLMKGDSAGACRRQSEDPDALSKASLDRLVHREVAQSG